MVAPGQNEHAWTQPLKHMRAYGKIAMANTNMNLTKYTWMEFGI